MKKLASLLSVLLIPALSVLASTPNDPAPSCNTASGGSSLSLAAFNLEEEPYVDDIPFNTKKIYRRACCFYKHYGRYAAEISLPDEDYIEDIPFNTEYIASTVMEDIPSTQSCQHSFLLVEESYIDDIPFDTEQFVKDTLGDVEPEKEQYTITSFNLSDEEYIDDIPWDTREVFAEVIHYPEQARKLNLEGAVLVTFHYNEDGYIEVDTAESNCEYLRNYIIEKLEEIRLTKGIVTVGKDYNARFDFILK
ncbi:MAG TPA: hypothetical protein PKH94_03730 [Bacteroidales bacterium]|nr:hypothetical protein [Bacteroidales bacterium]HNS46325.1 hypothetical protein [Bacteroidales bacterium]